MSQQRVLLPASAHPATARCHFDVCPAKRARSRTCASSLIMLPGWSTRPESSLAAQRLRGEPSDHSIAHRRSRNGGTSSSMGTRGSGGGGCSVRKGAVAAHRQTPILQSYGTSMPLSSAASSTVSLASTSSTCILPCSDKEEGEWSAG